MKTTTILNNEIITWALVTPFGKATSNFKTRLKNRGFQKGVAGMKNFAMHFADNEKAKKFCEELKKSKTSFSVLFITDKQFGEMQIFYK